MKRLNCTKIRFVLVGVIAALVLGGGRAKADFTFGEPVNLGPTINTAAFENSPYISADGLSLYFASQRPGGYGSGDLWLSTRDTTEDDWAEPVNLGPLVNGPSEEYQPAISTDGLELYFGRVRGDSPALGIDLWVARRDTTNEPWDQPVKLDLIVDTTDSEAAPSLSADGLELYFCFGKWDAPEISLAVTKRDTKDAPWGVPVSLGAVVNNWPCQVDPRISSDGLLLLFSDCAMYSPRPGGFGANDMWLTMRETKDSDWGEPVNLGQPVNSEFYDYCGMISADGSILYFSGNHDGEVDDNLWQAPIIPIVDFNGDKKVDIDDLVILIEYWGTSESLCDIGPMPWGDGTLDAADLEVLMRYWQQEILPPELLTYWKLDEREGSIAADSARDNDSTLSGGPLWQPEGGKVDGALQLDGIDDCLITPFILNPAGGQFSVFAWVKGGIPGQVIVSQIGGVDWLCADPSEGKLMTSLLPPPGRFVPQPLVSELVITDGNWHRIGFVWDGSHRRLYVDGVVASEDTQAALAGSTNGLYIGCGTAMGAGTFWSGLIDDVRIYDKALTAEQIAALAQ